MYNRGPVGRKQRFCGFRYMLHHLRKFTYLFIVLFFGARKRPLGLHKGAPIDVLKQCSIRSRHIKHKHNMKKQGHISEK